MRTRTRVGGANLNFPKLFLSKNELELPSDFRSFATIA